MNPAASLSDPYPFPGCIDPALVDASPTPDDDRHQVIGQSIFRRGRPVGDRMPMQRRRAMDAVSADGGQALAMHFGAHPGVSR